MSDRQELIDWLRHWKHEVPTTREREEMIEAMRDAATTLEEAQGVPRADSDFELELSSLLNRHSRENASNTPDFILARVMLNALHAHDEATRARDDWYGIKPAPGAAPAAPTREPTTDEIVKAAGICMGCETLGPECPTHGAAPTRDEQDARRLYHELLYAVATKHPGESRHETALRYIREREDMARHDAGANAALAEPKR